jgi:hypothetical protein
MRWQLARPGTVVSLVALAVAGSAAFASCNKNDSDTTAEPACTTTAAAESAAEWVNWHTEVPLVPSTFNALASGLFGSDAEAGKLVDNQQIADNYYLSAAADSATPEQTILTFAFDDGTNPRHTIATVPASFAVGNVFIAAANAALATMEGDVAMQPGSGEEFYLEYRVTSAMGGKISFGVRGFAGVYTMVYDITSPHTNLAPGKIGTAVDQFSPYDTVDGTVWFHLSQDEFDYFSNHAYGLGATSDQNFADFPLVPHDWLHLTVTPHLDQEYVNVSFDLVTANGQHTLVADAPASVLAGSTFQRMVDRNMENSSAQEAQKAGSSAPWLVPFYYDQPAGGGVVQVIAQGTLGIFEVEYAIETPQHPLNDVAFLPWQPVTLPTGAQAKACQALGNPDIVVAPAGTFDITFSASSTILKNPGPKPLVGDIECSVFKAADVNVTGPIAGAVSLQDFTVMNADLQGKTAPAFTTKVFPDGDYQILCFQDLAKNGDPTVGDPVTLPIGSFPIACNENPVAVEFAILDPECE